MGQGQSPDWTVDYVKITNDEDGRVWTTVNAELKGNQPHRLVFKLTIVVSTMRCSVERRKTTPSVNAEDEDADAKRRGSRRPTRKPLRKSAGIAKS
jgi:hypothetical protein